MSNDYFQFRQFRVRQHRCAMKVGTDGTLLGAWAQAPAGESRILDIGTGTGLIALMMAQRFPKAQVTGVEIDAEAAQQAQENVGESPFAERVSICQADIRHFETGHGLFDAVVSNPPYFPKDQSLGSPTRQRQTARQTDSLDFKTLCQAAARCMTTEGYFSVIIPFDAYTSFVSEALEECLYVSRIFKIRTKPQKAPKRLLIELKKQSVSEIYKEEVFLELSPGVRSDWYQELTQEFYIR